MRLVCGLVSTIVALGAVAFVGCTGPEYAAGDTEYYTIEDGYYIDQRDGNKYRVIKVGSDIWMAENLRYADSSASPNLKGNMWCPDDDASKCKNFGPLYSWTAAKDISEDYAQKSYGNGYYRLQGICPEGFRLPMNSDWVYLSKVAEKYSGSRSVAEMLKSPNGWESWGNDSYIYDSTKYSFDALPAGRRNIEGGFLESGLFAFFWTSEEIDDATASGWTLRDDNDVLDSGMYYKGHGMSVRCIATEPESMNWVGDEGNSGFYFYYELLDDGDQVYKTMKIGRYVWMVENMNRKTADSRCYGDKESNCKKYGALYSQREASLVCPVGWKLPSWVEWDNLFATAGNDVNALKAVGEWYMAMGTDALGFAALPAGIYDNGSYSDLTMSANFWMADEKDGYEAGTTGRTFSYHSSSMATGLFSSSTYASVRCVRDETIYY